MAKFKYNLSKRESETRPKFSKGEIEYDKHVNKHKKIQKKVEQKLKDAKSDLGVVTSSRGYYR